jgi:alpha-glucuronidase
MRKLLLAAFCFASSWMRAESGYELWLRYQPVQNQTVFAEYRKLVSASLSDGGAAMTVIRQEMDRAFTGMIGIKPKYSKGFNENSPLVLALFNAFKDISWASAEDRKKVGKEGFILKSVTFSGQTRIIIGANTEAGLLYGCFQLLREMATERPLEGISIVSAPGIQLRMLNHWDNLNRSVERGYAGNSIWNWHTLPDYIDPRYIDYARANASVGINAVSLTNVNANATVLTAPYLEKVKALADVFRPYHIRVFLTARFSAPMEIGQLKTADPFDPQVQQWWKDKASEIYKLVPDFGGFLVKANSEGQPGPQNYDRNHADGANMLAAAVKPFGGIIIWRAFVYSSETPEDRFKQPFAEFAPLDGKFADNVILQVKNGPIDFQPREPFHPLFGAMPQTPTMVEFQLTQEYLGFSTHLVFLATMFREVLDADTYRPEKGSTVAHIIDGSVYPYKMTGMAGVSNIGSDINWTGHPFAQANWYALGRLSWNPYLSAEKIADEWIRQTFSNKTVTVATIKKMMLSSHEITVNYMTPLGLHHIMGYGHHYGPAPWFNKASREDWNCTYFHRADSIGIGFDRTSKGSNALVQYAMPLQQQWGDIKTTGEQWLAWFHHVPWNYTLSSGETFWNTLALDYQQGVDGVRVMQQQWRSVKKDIDEERFTQVTMLLNIQAKEAVWWRDACLTYFQTFSKMPLPAKVESPAHTLEYYQQLTFPYAPGNGR